MNQYWSAIQPVLVTPTYQYWSRREVVLVNNSNQYWSLRRPVLVRIPPPVRSQTSAHNKG